MAWAKQMQSHPPRISLLASGLRRSLADLGVSLDVICHEPEPLLGSPAIPLLASRYGVPVAEIVPALGTSHALYLALQACTRPGDDVLVEHPVYDPLIRVPRSLGCRVIPVSRGPEDWGISPARILAAWTPRTRVVLVSDLHNPTGREAGDDALQALGALAEERGAWVVVDEVYRDFRPGPVGTARSLSSQILGISSLTKVYGLGGLRAGWVFAPTVLAEAMREQIELTHVVDPAPTQPFIRAALEHADTLRRDALARAAAVQAVASSWQGSARLLSPHGGIVHWAELPDGCSGDMVAERLLANGVAVVPGSFFGVDSAVRLATAVPDDLVQGLDALEVVLARLGA